jgi:hypothetical protein
MSLGTILGAGLQLAGGLLGKSSQDKANKIAQQNANRNFQTQREFAQNAISWRAADAKRAGIHPIFAMGSSPINFSPVSVGVSGRNPMADSLSSMGQDVSRAGMVNQSRRGRGQMMNAVLDKLGVERAGLQNELLRSQIKAVNMKVNQSQLPPPRVESISQQIIPGQADAPHMDPGIVTDVGHARTKTGYAPVPSEQVKERIEDILPQEVAHFIRNNVAPNLNQNFNPPFKAPKGKRWIFHPSQEYRLVNRNSWQDWLFGPVWE